MSNKRLYLLFFPLIFAYFLIPNPVLSYLAAWLGSFYLFYITSTGKVSPQPTDLTFAQQLMRPLIIIQFIFCGFNFCTSIFYFLNELGMRDFNWLDRYYIDLSKLDLLAKAQRFYLLGHTCLLLGIFNASKKPIEKYTLFNVDWTSFLIKLTFWSFLLSIAITFIPGFGQLSGQLKNLCFLAGTYALCYAILTKKIKTIIIAGLFYLYNFSAALLSGFKEPVIISLLLLGVFFYPHYKRLVIFSIVPFIYIAFVLLPAYVESFRLQQSENNALSIEEIRSEAFETAFDKKNETNWEFLTGRLSEVSMFTQFINSTPEKIPFYGFTTIQNSFEALIPRVLWPSKPITEKVVMERVYRAGVADERSSVSAKPMYIVDGYLAFGFIGVALSMFIYGLAIQGISQLAESWFGGYFLGTAIIFNGLFQIFWRGLSFEFILNSVLYALLTMYIIRGVLVRNGVLVKVQ